MDGATSMEHGNGSLVNDLNISNTSIQSYLFFLGVKMKTRFIMLIFLVYSISIFSQWQKVTDNFPYMVHAGYAIEAIESCVLVSMNYLSSEGVYPDTFSVFKTTNNGNIWSEIVPCYYGDNETAVDISSIDELRYWLATEEGRILATTDGGENWTVQFEDSSVTTFMNYIEMFDANNGIAMGDGHFDTAIFLHTTDGGLNWVSVNDSAFGAISFNAWNMLDFVNSSCGYFCVHDVAVQKSLIYKTTSGCASWEIVYTGQNIYDIKFFDVNHGMFLTYSGTNCKRTTDGGVTWENIPFNFGDWGTDIEFAGDDFKNVWVATPHKLYYSSDFGNTWINYPFDGNIRFRDIQFIDQYNGWLLTDQGVYHTINNGNVTRVNSEDNIITSFNLIQNYPNPFNSSTKINYQIPSERFIQLKLYDILGTEIETFVNEVQQAGEYSVNFNAKNLVSGVYIYKLIAGEFVKTMKMVLLK